MLLLMPLNHVPYSINMLLLPVWFVLLMALSMGFGLYTSALAVTYRDVNYVVPIMIQLLMYASPVGYGMNNVPASLRPYMDYNPLSGLLEAFRWSLLGSSNLTAPMLIYSSTVSIVVFIVGAYAFRRMERRFADVI
jgi:lipopolysaccharide transport system permease protein